jgi:hypothetical protein
MRSRELKRRRINKVTECKKKVGSKGKKEMMMVVGGVNIATDQKNHATGKRR